MSSIVIFADTSVLLNFICSDNQRYLVNFTRGNPIYVPTAVSREVERKLILQKFQAGHDRWKYLVNTGTIQILPDGAYLWKYVKGYAGPGYTAQNGLAKNLGEFFAIAHCLALKDSNPRAKLAIIMDDEEGREIARKRQAATIFNSVDVLLRNIQLGHITDRGQAREIWEKLKELDVLVPFESTPLNKREYYRSAQE